MNKKIFVFFIVGLIITSVTCIVASQLSKDVDHSEEEIEPVLKDVAVLGSRLPVWCGDGDIPEDVDPDGLEG